MKSKEEKKYYPVECSGYWFIQSGPNYEDPDILDAEKVGEERAEKNARLIADLLNAHYAQQSQPSGMRWVRVEDYKGYDGRILVFSPIYPIRDLMRYRIIDSQFLKTCKDVTHYHILKEPSESSPAGAAEGASEGISKIREVMNWISQCVDEDHDLEVSEIKMIWNDLSDAILLIKSTPHSGEGMAEALRLKWITLTEDMGRMLSGQRGVSIDKLNKVMNLVQEFVNTLPASLSSPGSGWVKTIKTLEDIIELKEKERKEWADMCIKKQARIEELEKLLK